MTTFTIDDKLLVSSGLMDEPHFRRLLKFQTRRREGIAGRELDIRTTSSYVLGSEDDTAASYTVYSMHIRRATETRLNTDGHWILKKRYSELEAFRRLLLKRIADWENTVTREFTSKTSIGSHKAFAVVSNAMRRAISPSFPKKHVRSNKPCVVKERVGGLPSFVRKLLGVYTDLSVYKTNHHLQAGGFASSWAQLCTIFDELEVFLQVPQPQKDAEIQRQTAVLALKDFKVHAKPADAEEQCSICLNEDLAHEEARPVVSLPCGHHFHEDCVIDWFSTSATCPLCRAS